MKKIALYILILVSVIFTNVAKAQKETPPPGGVAKDFKLSEKKKGKLANGLHTTMVQYGDLPKVTINLTISTGSIHEAADRKSVV